ncbi:MAG: SEC-C domain-containing protein [Myxococcota bacterium]
MSQPTHFLERLSRAATREAELATELSRDSVALRGFLAEALERFPEIPRAPRYALPLSPAAQPAHMLVSPDGGAVTCLAPGMPLHDASVIPYGLVNSFVVELRAAMRAAVALAREEARGDRNAVMRLVRAAHELTDDDIATLSAIVPLTARLLGDCVTHGVKLLRTDLPGPIRRNPAGTVGLARRWWPRYMRAVHAMLLGAPEAFSAQTVVLHTAVPDVYVSSRAIWAAARRGSETLDVLESLAERQGLLGGEHELAVAVAEREPLLAGRVRRFIKTFKNRQGALYLQLLQKALDEPARAFNHAVVPLLPLLPTMLAPAEVDAQLDVLGAPALLQRARQLDASPDKPALDVARKLHPRVASLLEQWMSSDGASATALWKAFMLNAVVRLNSYPFGVVLCARAPREAFLPGATPPSRWDLDTGADYIRLVMPAWLPPDESATPRKLPPNSPCWCGSGKKYKKCHLDAG